MNQLRSLLTVLVTVLFTFTITGCETGTEVVGIESAQAHRELDGRIRVDVLLACELVAGMPRADDSCDADGEDFCVEAQILAADGTELGHASGCDSFKRVRGKRMAVHTEAMPATATGVRVWSSMRGQGHSRTITIASP